MIFTNYSFSIFSFLRLLSQNSSLLQLYKDLVITQVLTADEFWAKHAAKFMQKQKAQAQEIGVSGAFLVRNLQSILINGILCNF